MSLIACAAVLLFAGLRFAKLPDNQETIGERAKPGIDPTNAELVQPTSMAVGPTVHLTSTPNSSGALDTAFRETLARLRVDRKPEKSRILVQTLQEQVKRSSPGGESAAAILRFLDSGQDEATALSFRVGPGHSLAEAPTLRTAALDWLGQLDPAAAADYSIQIFEAMSSPEEYAVALRNFARGRPNQREELRNYFDRLRTHQPWANQPTAGYLEAFDLFPYLADRVFLQPLASLLAPSSPTALRHASLVALDRLVIANAPGVLADIVESNSLEAQPKMRAAFVARADIRDPSQRQAVERYLLSLGRSELEVDNFVLLFPNANRFVSYNLLTDSGGPSLADIAQLDKASLERVRCWQKDPQFQRWRLQLERLATRLQQHVDSAIRGGYLSQK